MAESVFTRRQKLFGGLRTIGEYEAKAARAAGKWAKRGFLEAAKYTATGLEILEQNKLDELKSRESRGLPLSDYEKREIERLERKVKKTQATEERIKTRIEVFKKAEQEKKALSKGTLTEITGEPKVVYESYEAK